VQWAENGKIVFLITSYSLVQKLLLQNVSFSHNTQHRKQTDRQTDDSIMPIANEWLRNQHARL